MKLKFWKTGVLSITTSMTKNVIFDLGGVLIRFQPKEAIHQLGLSKEKEDALYSNVIKLSKNKNLEFYLATGKALFLMKYFFSYE